MRIKGEREAMSTEQIAAFEKLGQTSLQSAFCVDIGREYDALAIYLKAGLSWVLFTTQYRQARVAPLCLFSIVDGALDSSWRVSLQQHGTVVFFASPEASDLQLADKVDELVPAALQVWNRLLANSKDLE